MYSGPSSSRTVSIHQLPEGGSACSSVVVTITNPCVSAANGDIYVLCENPEVMDHRIASLTFVPQKLDGLKTCLWAANGFHYFGSGCQIKCCRLVILAISSQHKVSSLCCNLAQRSQATWFFHACSERVAGSLIRIGNIFTVGTKAWNEAVAYPEEMVGGGRRSVQAAP